MAHVTTTSTAATARPERPSPFAAFYAALLKARDAAARRRLYQLTVRELSAMSDRDLADLGLSRNQIPNIAQAQVYGA